MNEQAARTMVVDEVGILNLSPEPEASFWPGFWGLG
jgi:hypothetical protein